MVFSSLVFLFYFLPTVFIFYFLVPKKFRNLVLLLASLFFYAWGEPKYIWLITISTLIDFVCGLGIHHAQQKNNDFVAKLFLILSITANLSFLAFFKYSNFIIMNFNAISNTNFDLLNVVLPIGISFYTFQTMSYSIDVYRKEAKVQTNIINFASYVTLFPQLVAGPIVRYQTVSSEIENRVESIDLIYTGTIRFLIGLSKKVLLANNIGLVWDVISQHQENISILGAWLGILCFALQIYFDFSGYSDMAIGLGKIFGFNFPENFNYPYMAKSISEFWRRWHISLGTWFREYLYIPLGGNRVSDLKWIRNILIVWTLTGVWHGASWNFVVWGLMFAVILILEKKYILNWLNKVPQWMRLFYTLFLIAISWALFAFDSFNESYVFIKSMFGQLDIPLYNDMFLYLSKSNFILVLICIIGATPFPKKIITRFFAEETRYKFILENIYLISIFLLSVANLVDSSYNPFLYFKF